MIYKIYSEVKTYYQQLDMSKVSFIRLVLENLVCYSVKIMQLTTGIKFPKRAIGGWWWTWRWRFEILTNMYDYYIVKYCQQFIKPGMVVVDVGAHIGYYTWIFSELVGPSGKVISYEPSPENFPILVHNIKKKHLHNVIPIQ
jgi:hypothetical protein